MLLRSPSLSDLPRCRSSTPISISGISTATICLGSWTSRRSSSATATIPPSSATICPADYRHDSANFDVAGTVFVETEWDPRDPTGEVRWVEALKAREGLPSRDGGAGMARSRRRTGGSRVRMARARSCAASATSRAPRRGLTWSSLAPRGRWAIRRSGAALRCSGRTGCPMTSRRPGGICPRRGRWPTNFHDTQIILNHTGLPADRSPEGLAGWRAAMREAGRRAKRGAQDLRTWPGWAAVVGGRQSLASCSTLSRSSGPSA